MRGIRFPGVSLNALGGRKYVLRRLRREYTRQYAEARRQVLGLLIAFIERRGDERKDRPLTFFGTNAMNLVWEKALAEVLDNQLQQPIGNIEALPEEQRRMYADRDKKLIEIIDKPHWSLKEKGTAETATLIPDTIGINEKGFVIYDAKYYVPLVGKNKDGQVTISRQPALESVTKQYLYQMAYRDFLQYFGLTDKVQIVFLMPRMSQQHDQEQGPFYRFGEVDFSILRQYTGRPVEAFYVDADAVWQAYVSGEKMVFKDGCSDEKPAT